MKSSTRAAITAGILCLAAPAFPQSENQGQGRAIVTILPKHDNDANASPAQISQQSLKIEVNGKESSVTGWRSLQGDQNALEVVLLIDSSARWTLGTQLDTLAKFVQHLPPTARVGIAYMQNGRAAFPGNGQLTDNKAEVLQGLHIPAGSPGESASPYFCLSDLAKRWPSQVIGARREVIMITDGIDYYQPRFDPDDPYVEAAIKDSVRAGLVVYSLYWQNQGQLDRSGFASNGGQSLLSEVSEATGGVSYWEGAGNPVSFEPYLDEISRRLHNQYELAFTTAFNGKPQVEALKLKLAAPGDKVDAPHQVFVYREGTALVQ
jgi:hypothetical protein